MNYNLRAPNIQTRHSFFFASKFLTSFLWLSIILWNKNAQADRECEQVSNLVQLSENDDCVAKYLQGASYCCPDYQCCSEEELRTVGTPCPCSADQECCDGKFCCTALESEKIGKKCIEDESSSYCDLENFSELKCCANEAAAAERVCCTEEQFLSQDLFCYNDRDCPHHMECIDSESGCHFNISFDEKEVTLFIIVFILIAIVVIIVAIVCAVCIFSRRRRSKEKESGSSFKPAEDRRSVSTLPQQGSRTVVQIPTASRDVPETNYTNYGFRYSAALENSEMQLYDKEPRSGTPSGSMYPQSRSQNSESSNNLPNRGIYQRRDPLPRNNFDPSLRNLDFGAVNHGYQNSHPSMGEDLGVHRPPRYMSTPDPPPRSRSSMEAVSKNRPPGLNDQRVKSHPNPVAQNGPRRHVVEEDDKNDTLVIATDSLVINNQAISEKADNPELNSNYRNRGFLSSEVNIDNPYH